jgi:hypothetical protein
MNRGEVASPSTQWAMKVDSEEVHTKHEVEAYIRK